MKRWTTPIDEYVDQMSKEELYDEYFGTYQELAQCLEQLEEIEYFIKTQKEKTDTLSISNMEAMLEIFKRNRHDLFNKYFSLSEEDLWQKLD